MDIITAGAAVVPYDLRPALFDDFIRFIDRGQRTTKTYITNLRQFMAWLSFQNISRPTRQDIISYRDYLTVEHEAIKFDPVNGWAYRTDGRGRRVAIACKANTVAQYLRSVCQFFRWTAAAGYYPNIADNIHAPKTRKDIHRKEALTASEVLDIERSIKAKAEARTAKAKEAGKDAEGKTQRATEAGKRLYAMYLLAVNAGLRTIELSRANIKDIQVKNGQAVLYVWGKGHTEPDTKKPLAPEVYQAIKDYLESRADRTGALFVATGNRSGGQRLAETTISKMLKQAMKEPGFDSESITAHTLRHTAGTNVQEITNNIYLTQKYMRHNNPSTTEIYLHNNTERQEAQTAQDLYNLYHGITGNRLERLETIIKGMSPEQLERLADIAEAMR